MPALAQPLPEPLGPAVPAHPINGGLTGGDTNFNTLEFVTPFSPFAGQITMNKAVALAVLAASLVLTACGGAESPSEAPQSAPSAAAQPAAQWTKPEGNAKLTTARSPAAGEGPMLNSGNLLPNGDFERGTDAWVTTDRVLYTDSNAHAGTSYAWLGGYNNGFDRINQNISLPESAASVTLRFWNRIVTAETLQGMYDGMLVSLHDANTGETLANIKLYSNLDKTDGWVQSEAFDLSAYRGRFVDLRFSAITDESEISSFVIDDIVLSANLITGTVLAGAQADYTISRSRSSYRLTTNATGAVQTFNAGERLHFSDASVALDDSGNAAQVYRLYQAAFDRKPDQGGLGYQIAAIEDSGLPLALVSQNFINSPEFASRYGSLDNSRFVSQLYQNVLHRAPDADGLAYHVNRLGTGTARRDVLIGFSESPENQATVGAAIANGIVFTPLTPVPRPVAPAAPTCVAPKVIINGNCAAPSTQAPTCSSSEVLRDGVCVARVTSCVAPATLVNGSCYIPPPTCTGNTVLQNGICVPVVVTCTAPKVLQNGACVVLPPTAPSVPRCTAPKVLQNNICVTPALYPCLPWVQQYYQAGAVVSYNGKYYQANITRDDVLRPGAMVNGTAAWSEITKQACGAAPPALNGSVVLENVVFGTGQYSYVYKTYMPSFKAELLNELGETVKLRVCYPGSGFHAAQHPVTGSCTAVDSFKDKTVVRVDNNTLYAHGTFEAYVQRSLELDPSQEWIKVGSWDARDYGFATVVTPAPDNRCIINGSIKSTDPTCNTLSPPPAPAQPTPRAPSTPTAPPSTPPAGSGGANASGCVAMSRGVDTVTGKDKVTLTNNCGKPIFILYCGDLAYSTLKCGNDSNYFTHSYNSKPDEISRVDSKAVKPNGNFRWGACFGQMSFGNEGNYKAYADGSYVCLKQ